MRIHRENQPISLPQCLRGRDMLCFSHDFSAGPLSKTHLMRRLAQNGNRVLWVNSIGYRNPTVCASDLRRAVQKLGAAIRPMEEVEANLFVLNPLVIPFHGQPLARRFNRHFLRLQVRRAMRKLNFQHPLNWVFNPAAALVAGTLDEDRVIYYCVDEYAAFRGVCAKRLAQLEGQLLRRADLVIVSGQRLYESKRPFNAHTVLVRHGVDVEHFAQALDERNPLPLPADLAQLPRPIIGYFGLIAHDWVDVPLVAHVARSFAQASIVMLGRSAMDVSALRSLPNVHLLGHKPYAALPAYCRGFDAAMIPFPINAATLAANPLKAREYLAAGLPVVSTDIPEVRFLAACRIAADRDDFVRQLQAALADATPRASRARIVQGESWESRLAEIGNHLEAIETSQAPLRLSDFFDWRSIWSAPEKVWKRKGA